MRTSCKFSNIIIVQSDSLSSLIAYYEFIPMISFANRFPNLWKQRTLLEKVLIILYLIIGTTILIAAVIFYLIFSRDQSVGAGNWKLLKFDQQN